MIFYFTLWAIFTFALMVYLHRRNFRWEADRWGFIAIGTVLLLFWPISVPVFVLSYLAKRLGERLRK